MTPPPDVRVRVVQDAPVRDRAYILYWSIAARRTTWNFALDRALAWGRSLGRGVVVLEALRVDAPWSSVRFHTFVRQGMADNARRYAAAGVAYHPWIEPSPGAGHGLLAALAAHACVVVADDYPVFFLPRMLAAAAADLDVRVEAVDGNGIVPLGAPRKEYKRAADFRRALPGWLATHSGRPTADPLATYDLPRASLPADVVSRWPVVDVDLERLPIARLAPIPSRGGELAGRAALAGFLSRVERYAEDRDHPDLDGTSGLSAWLHWGHLSAHEAVDAVQRACPGDVGPFAVTASAAAFLDQLVTWRELAYHSARARPDAERYASLPEWARRTLAEHATDPRLAVYDLDALAEARTADPIWNAAQRQLVTDGRIHNAMRMVWGKLVIGWTPSPEAAFDTLVELNNRYAIDGRDPCSWAGIAWCFGRYDRAWGPERPIYGKVRFMTSALAARKRRLRQWLARWSSA